MKVEVDARITAVVLRAIAQLGVDARADAELLLAHVLHRSRAWLYAHGDDDVAASDLSLFDQMLARRSAGEPIAQLIGRKGFWTLELNVTKDVLIPRADTELLVERTLMVLPVDQVRRVADLGTGSGAIALAIARDRPLAQIIAVDSSDAALVVARGNAESLGLSNRVEFIVSDWFAGLDGERFDAIASNPPYLAADDTHLEQGDLRFEPRSALVSGSDGLDAIRKITGEAAAHLWPDGWLLFEHGWEQATAVRAVMLAAGFADVATHRDIEQRERVTCGRCAPITAP